MEKTREQKIGQASKEHWQSPEYREKMSMARKKVWANSEFKKRISERMSGENNPFFGKNHTQETKDRISSIQIGKKLSEETKKKIGLKSKGNQHCLGQKHSQETKLKMSKARSGENHYAWKKDRNSLTKRDHRSTKEFIYREWREKVFGRDNWKCKMANENCNGQLEAHHILPWRDYPELRYEINNGITLCHAHHPRKRAEEKRLSPYFMELVSVSK